MPTYDFECNACCERFEAQTPAGADPPPCAACGATDTRRLFGSFAMWRTNKSPGQRRRLEAERRDAKDRKREEFAREQAKRPGAQ